MDCLKLQIDQNIHSLAEKKGGKVLQSGKIAFANSPKRSKSANSSKVSQGYSLTSGKRKPAGL
eukprot:1156221-Pelagomonas_calceolata.AAC.16